MKTTSQLQREWFEKIQIARALKQAKISRGIVARELHR